MNDTCRLVTRSDFDGLMCAVLLNEMHLIDDIVFAEPGDLQQGLIQLTDRDITCDLPFMPEVHLAFDHHASELTRVKQCADNHVIIPLAPSTARVVYDYYGGAHTFPHISGYLMEAVDAIDSARLSREEILHPSGYILLGFLCDPRTGLYLFKDFATSHIAFLMKLIETMGRQDISNILEIPMVKERASLYYEHAKPFNHLIKRCTSVHGNVVVFDPRGENDLYIGNRFVIYALYPGCNVSITLTQRHDGFTSLSVGKSILDRSSSAKIGDILLAFNGGGHDNAGSCRVENGLVDSVLRELISIFKAA